MKSLVILNLGISDNPLAIENKISNILQDREDVILIKNPQNISQLQQELQKYKGQYDQIFVDTHGDAINDLPTMSLTAQDEYLEVYDVIDIINKESDGNIKDFHILSCKAGTNFSKKQNLESLSNVVLDGQRVYIHTDEKNTSKVNNFERIKRLLSNRSSIITKSILASPDALNVFLKFEGEGNYDHSSFEVFSKNGSEISLENLRIYLSQELKDASDFEAKYHLDQDSEFSLDLDDEFLRSYLGVIFTTLISKVSNEEDEKHFVSMWTKAIKSKLFDINQTNPILEQTTLIQAIFNNRVIIAKFLIDNAADINKERPDGDTPLGTACERGYFEIVKYLFDNKSNIHKVDISKGRSDSGSSPLYLAVENGHFEIAKFLVERGADINKGRSDIGSTPLYVACEKGYLDLVQYLVKEGAKINEGRSDIGSSPLYMACEKGYLDLVQYLVKEGAKINEGRSDIGTTPLYMACEKGYLDLVQYLVKEGADINQARYYLKNTPLYIACQNSHFETARYLVENKAEINSVQQHGFAPIHFVAKRGDIKLLEFFINNRADVNLVSNNGLTPLVLAISNNDLAMVQLLIDKGAKIDLTNDSGNKILDEALLTGNIEIFKLIINNVNLSSNSEHTALLERLLDSATNDNNQEIAEFLEKRIAEINELSLDNFNLNIDEIRPNDSQITFDQTLNSLTKKDPISSHSHYKKFENRHLYPIYPSLGNSFNKQQTKINQLDQSTRDILNFSRLGFAGIILAVAAAYFYRTKNKHNQRSKPDSQEFSKTDLNPSPSPSQNQNQNIKRRTVGTKISQHLYTV